MEQIKTFSFTNSLLSGRVHERFEEVFNITHHFVTGKYHDGKTDVDFVNDLTTGQLTNLIFSNPSVSGIFNQKTDILGNYIFGLKDKNNRIWVAVEDKKKTIYFNTNYKKKLEFEDCIDIVDNEIQKRRTKWHLTAIQWMDYDDVSQILRLHIYKKFNMWDQSRALEPWLNTIISHQISNLLRNHYGNYSRPCLRCDKNEGGDLCSLFTTQCSACDLYKKWLQTKKSAYDSKLPLPLENHTQEVFDKPTIAIDVEGGIKDLEKQMKKTLKPIEYKIFKFLYIDGGKEEKIAKLLGFKTTEENRSPGYRQIKNIKDLIYKKVKEAIYSGGVDF